MALAQGIIEFVHEKVKAVMMFSTHYHELTQLEAALKRLKNIHVSAVLDKGSLVFMHKVKEGPRINLTGSMSLRLQNCLNH